MTGSGISREASVRTGVPAPRAVDEADRARADASRAARCLAAVRDATERLDRVVADMDDEWVRQPSLLPGWSRAHVITHLARNADGLVNLLTWARTGIEHAMYASTADRDADIEEGASRLAQVLHEDLLAASERFLSMAGQLTESQWQARVGDRHGNTFPAAAIPYLRLFEVSVHTVDLNAGVGFADVPPELRETLLEHAITRHRHRDDLPAVRVTAELPDGRVRHWDLPGDGARQQVRGPAVDLLGWLTGRTDGAGLTGSVPSLPAWG